MPAPRSLWRRKRATDDDLADDVTTDSEEQPGEPGGGETVARQGGLGRGLAALLPAEATEPEEPLRPVSEAPPPTRATSDFGAELIAELATNESGLGLIYRALDMLVERFELRDAAIVIEEHGVGRQVFRAGRRPLDDENESELLSAEPGIYTEPEIEAGRFDASLLTSMCVVALRLDLLRYDSWHDQLTGLFDRRSFDRLLEMSVARSLRYQWPFTLVVLDIDTFKAINDRDGHAAGDQALRSLGERFRRVLRFGDNAARIGGDEFALILPNTDPDDVPALLERLAEVTGVEGACPPFSFGVALCPGEADDVDSLFRLADERLYEAKEGRR
jgi:diguanylate cyclase (GGDEF)-like protein